MTMLLHLSLNHLSKLRRSDRLLHQCYLFSATALSFFSAAVITCASAAQPPPKPHFPDPPSNSAPKAPPPLLLSSPERRPKVFLSFRGEDTRQGFVKSLHKALALFGIPVFKDDVDLTKGGRIRRGLMDAIHHSWVFIPVISANYASSKWCLEELAEIMKCVKKEKKTVIPVFYDVRPTDARHLKAPFSAAFAELEVEDSSKVNAWKRALSEVVEFSGFDLIGTYHRCWTPQLSEPPSNKRRSALGLRSYFFLLVPNRQLPGYIFQFDHFFTLSLISTSTWPAGLINIMQG